MSSESPRSEKDVTRYSTPVPELDDHRFQSSSLPRAEMMGSVPRRNTARSGSVDRSGLLQVNEALREAGPVSRDFEHAIVDDDRCATRSVNDVEAIGGRRGSVSPAVNRRSIRKRSRNQQDRPNRSRASSTSSMSSSLPNSVEAFADPRRRERANTLGSRAPSDIEVGGQRTISGGTQQRRPTFSNASVVRAQTKDKGQDSDEDDVCFPTYEEPGKTSKIDYEELEEFVALSNQAKPPGAIQCRRKHSLSSQSKPPMIFNDLRKQSAHVDVDIPEIVTHLVSPQPSTNGLPVDEMEEKSSDRKDEKIDLAELENENEPSRFSFFSSDLQSTIHAAELGDLVLPGDSFRDLFELDLDGGVWWLDVLHPTDEEVGAISRAFNIHPLTSEDIMTQEAREKVELFRQYYFVCFRTFNQVDPNHEDYMEPLNIYMIVFREGVISFSFSESPHAANVRKRIGKLRDYVALSSDWICYAMI